MPDAVIETIAYMLEGECAVYYGDSLQQRVLVRQGEQCFVAADVSHAPSNESGKPCTWIVVNSSGSDQDGVVLLPHVHAMSVSVASVVVQDESMPKTRTRVCLEDGLKLDLNRLLRHGSVRSGARTGPLCIQWKRDGQVLAQVWITANMEGTCQGWFDLRLGDLQQTIALRAMPRHFGGKQWYFICPRTCRPVSVVWMPPGTKQFASRQFWGRRVAYASQFQTPLDRALHAKDKIKARLIAGLDPNEADFPPKTKWMRWKTYQRYVKKYERYEAIIDQQFWRTAARLVGIGFPV